MDVAFHERVIAGYKSLIAADPSRWRVVDATRDVASVQENIRSLVMRGAV
jgi:dTMP kinase